MVLPRDYFYNIYAATSQTPSGLVLSGGRMTISPMGPNFRRNIGMRTLSDVQIVAVILRKDGRQETSLPRTYPGDYSFMMPVEQFVQQMFTGPNATSPLTSDDAVAINASPGRAITYYTYTDNRTNDPALVVSPAEDVNVMLEQLPNP